MLSLGEKLRKVYLNLVPREATVVSMLSLGEKLRNVYLNLVPREVIVVFMLSLGGFWPILSNFT